MALSLSYRSTNTKQLKERSYPRKVNTKYLITGYCRKSSGKYVVTSSILDIILYYYPKMNGYKFVWNISPLSTYSSSTLTKFDSDPFDIGLSNNFFLRLQLVKTVPNNNQQRNNNSSSWGTGWGNNNNHNNNNRNVDEVDTKEVEYHYSLSLISFPLPSQFQWIIMHIELYCNELNEEYSAIWNISNQGSTIQFGQNRQYEQRHNNSDAIKFMKMNWKLYENEKYIERYLQTKGLTFECKLNILKVYPNDPRSVKKIENKFYSYESMGYNNYNKMRFIWRINDKYMINKLMDTVNGISYHSDVYYDLFQLKIHKLVSKICFIIQLCGLPKYVESIAVKWEIFAIDEMDKAQNKIKVVSQIITYSYANAIYNFTQDQNEILSDLLVKYRKLTLYCKGHIIQRYDKTGNLVTINELKNKAKESKYVKGKKDSNDSKDSKATGKDMKVVDINLDEIKQEIMHSKSKIFKPKIDSFTCDITKQFKTLNLKRQDYFNSDIFTLFDDKYKWYISVYCFGTNNVNNESSMTWNWEDNARNNNRSWRWGNTKNNNAYGDWVNRETNTKYVGRNDINDGDIIISVKSLCPCKHVITCKIYIYVLELNKKCEYFRTFGHYNADDENRFRDWYLQCNSNKLRKLDTITVKIVMELVSAETDVGSLVQEDIFPNQKIKNSDNVTMISKEVKIWLCDTVKLPEYCELFQLHGIDDMDVVKLLMIDDLKAMGINKIGHQIKLMSKIKLLQ